MNLNISDKKALVFGGSAGIGKAIARELIKEGAIVCIAARDSERLAQALDELKSLAKDPQNCTAQKCDTSVKSDLVETFRFFEQKFGEVDILINNQGGPPAGAFDAVEEEELVKAVQTNLLPFFRTVKHCLPKMQKNKWGRIINILSISAKEPLPNMLLSNMMRPAILGMSKTISSDVAKYGVTINNILPSAVLTERSRSLVEERAKREKKTVDDILTEIASTLPSRYIASPEEVAKIAVFLCSEGAGYINGASIPVDGAASKGLF